MNENETRRTPPADAETAAAPAERGGAAVNVVPFPGRRKTPAARPENVLFEPDDFDPGPGAA
jgi:hypothetical protein